LKPHPYKGPRITKMSTKPEVKRTLTKEQQLKMKEGRERVATEKLKAELDAMEKLKKKMEKKMSKLSDKTSTEVVQQSEPSDDPVPQVVETTQETHITVPSQEEFHEWKLKRAMEEEIKEQQDKTKKAVATPKDDKKSVNVKKTAPVKTPKPKDTEKEKEELRLKEEKEKEELRLKEEKEKEEQRLKEEKEKEEQRLKEEKEKEEQRLKEESEKTYKKRGIGKKVKTDVWNKYIGSEIPKHKCLCCKMVTISNTDFDCGHVESEANGGGDEICNLRPICRGCNTSMSTQNMVEYVKKHGYWIG